MDFLKGVFGDPKELLARVLTHTSAEAAKPVLVRFFNERMNAAGRIRLGEHLIAAGAALKTGAVAEASTRLAAVIGEIHL
jgi:hypothetical protein